MRALLQPAFGDASVLQLAEVEPPTPGDDEVQIRMVTASLNFADRMTLLGVPVLFRPLAYGVSGPRQAVAGLAGAGRVESVGKDVSGFAPGDAVVGWIPGACGEIAVAPARHLAHKPEGVTFKAAATLPIAATTALQGLRDLGNVQPGQEVLVNGASGGVGSFAVQIASARGADVTAVCSTRNLEQARDLGAYAVIDYTSADYTEGRARFDVLFDLVGNHRLGRRLGVVKPDGRYVASFGQGGGRWLGPLGRIFAVVFRSLFDRRIKLLSEALEPSDLEEILALVETGQVTPLIEQTYALADAKEAFASLLEGHTRGKLVIRV